MRADGSWSYARLTVAVVGATAVLGIASFAWIYGAGLLHGDGGPIRSDGLGYYVYLPALLLDHDVTLQQTARRSFGGDLGAIQGARPVPPRNRPLDQYGVGEGVMIAPFFGVGHILAVVAGANRNGFSWPYQAAAAAAGFVYALLGLVLTASLLRRWHRPSTVAVTLVAITFGTDLFHYATYDATFSHAFSFCLIACVLRLSVSAWERPRPSVAVALGAVAGLVGLVRPTNLVVLLACVLIGVERLADLPARGVALVRRLDLLALGVGVFIVACLPQLAYWEAITGKAFVVAYPKESGHLDLLHLHLVGVLFSVRKGLFFWTPLLLLAVAGIPLLRRVAPELFLPVVVYLVVDTWVIASWSVWWYGGSFGMRPFAEAMPFFALGLAALIESARRRPAARSAVRVGIALTTVLAVHAMLAYWLRWISIDQATFRQYLDSFGRY